MKTRADLFRDAKSGHLYLEMTERYGRTIPPEERQKRQVVKANTVDLILEDDKKNRSHLSIPRATLVDYTDSTLTIHTFGYREPTAQEAQILAGWEKITNTPEYKTMETNDLLSDGSSSYWKMVRYFTDHHAKYLMGFDREHGACLDFNRRSDQLPDFISDEKVKGEPILKYNVYLG